ncbi:MAG: alpha/beta hydrolase [Prolixibacteraceae bacterium]|nr:alpha/beta hydrolase [Prolixibacteraceae bacterium]MBT6764796.1 alpha/beta hydrolase [Prolixibacteraceae bacterium]MBT6997725.1 alpha/beta hydrolase [Prolixibacteraceae bacterium]MBT7396503.1 alpha/beta hydrolase [Prolixibacteraceae bacterium]
MNIIQDKIKPLTKDSVFVTFVNEKYGSHERNTFDIWLADSENPTPLVIYIHGGGFTGGDKSKYYDCKDWPRLLEAGISIATINYRFLNEEPYGILASLMDSKRCLQYIRYNAEKYNIDKNKVACSGGSAGAGTSLWIAFSDDMADPLNEDPVLRESTRISCAGAFNTQSTYDIFQWQKILGIPVTNGSEQQLLIARAFGFKSADGIDFEQKTDIRKELDFLGKMDKNDPPIFVFNKQEGGIPTTQGEINHHPLHAKVLKEKAEKVGLEAVVYAPGIGIEDPSGRDFVDFVLDKFKN